MLRVTADMLRKRNGFGLGLSTRDQVGEPEAEIVALRGPARDKSLLLPGAPAGNGSVRWLMVERVEAGSIAQKAGLEAGDVLLQVGGQLVSCNLELERALLDKRPNETLPLVVRRKDAEKRLALSLERTALLPSEMIWKRIGLRLEPINAEMVARVDPTRTLRGGMLVSDVEKTGPAGRMGVRRGDILVGMNGYETITMENVAYVLNHAEQEKVRIDQEKTRLELERHGWTPTRFAAKKSGFAPTWKSCVASFFVIHDGKLHQGTVVPTRTGG